VKFSKEQQYLVLGVLAFLVVGGLYYQFMLKPIWSNIESLKSTLQKKEQDLQDAKSIVAKYAEFKKRSSSIQRELEWYQNRIPASVDRVKMLDALQVLQSRSGVRLLDFKADAQPVKKEKYTELPVGVRFNASYRQMLEFIRQMASTETLLTVRDIKLTRQANSTTGTSTLVGEMQVKGAMSNEASGGANK
jgi:type IV pilus assembly protein PilO